MSTTTTMPAAQASAQDHKVVSRSEWLAARKELLQVEKELTRRNDELARRRQALPWVRVDKEYRFENEAGAVSLADLFRGRSQLIVYHFMFGPDYEAGCPSCSSIADGFNGFAIHLENHDVALTAVSRAPFDKLKAYRQRLGWSFPWASSFGSDFNFDYGVSFTAEQQRSGQVDYNYSLGGHPSEAEEIPEDVVKFAATCGTDFHTFAQERPGMSSFIMKNGVIYHTYSAYSRGVDALWGMYQWLDRAPLGRNETGNWWKRNDEYQRETEPSCCCKGTS